jgi:nicotinamidase-related amidase
VGGLLERGMPSSQVLFLEDHHPQSAEEFAAFPPHCISATQEAEPAAELRALAAWPEFTRLPKNSVASHSNPALDTWLERCPARQIVAVGDVTDLCLYALALHLITRSQARSLGQRIIVPENAAQTWDAPDHPGDLYHLLFLHQLARLGVQVVSRVLL